MTDVTWRSRVQAIAPWLALSVVSSAPMFVVERPPLQDLPFHLAAIRVVHDLHNPTYGFSDVFRLNLGQTQYVLYHLIASALGSVVGITFANRLLVSVYLGGTILAMRSLLLALGRDERVAVFVGPLLVNVMFIFGLLPFLLAIPMMIWAIGLIARFYDQPTWPRGLLVASTCVAMFYLHVVPLGLLGVGAVAMFPWTRPKRWLVAALPGLPVVALLVWWSFATTAGTLARQAILNPSTPSKLSSWAKLKDAFNWLGDTYRDYTDEATWGLVVALAIAATIIAIASGKRPAKRLALYAIVPATCAALFFVTGEQHANIWLIWQRFPMLFCLTLVPLFDMPRGASGRVLTGLGVCLSVACTINACVHFRRFERDDVADFDHALASMDPRKHVMGLIWERESTVIQRHPLLHFVSYYQVEKGGVVQFTYCGFPHWPFHFAEGQCPPQGCQAKLDWEWHPEWVKTDEVYPYYDYVLTRGEGFDGEDKYRKKWSGHLWTVWERH